MTHEEMNDNFETLIQAVNLVAEELHVLHQAVEEFRELLAWALVNEKFRTPPDEWKAAQPKLPEPKAIQRAREVQKSDAEKNAAYNRKKMRTDKEEKRLF